MSICRTSASPFLRQGQPSLLHSLILFRSGATKNWASGLTQVSFYNILVKQVGAKYARLRHRPELQTLLCCLAT
jgi:hypothetical protein